MGAGASGDPIVLNDNGGWSWFEDERAVVDATAGKLLVSSVASAEGAGGEARQGNVEVVAFDLATGGVERAVLHPNLQADDHDSAALYVRPDGRYLAMYSKHATDHLTRWRVSRRPGDVTDWEPEATLDNGAPTTYSNVYPADPDGTLYAFVRAAGRDPHVLVSTDHGTTWRPGGRVLDGPGRPYVRYATRRPGRIHLVTTDQHPRDFANRVYHGVVAGRALLGSDGTVVDEDVLDGVAARPDRLTEVHAGQAAEHAWTVDLQVDDDDHPYTVFSVATVPDPSAPGESVPVRHRYDVAWFDGATWSVRFLAPAGTALYRAEPFYTGLVALHPHDPRRVFVSTDVDPVTGVPLISAADGRRHHELFAGVTTDGATWTWTSITADSTVDNIRPVVPVWQPGHTALLWLRGTYTTYHRYDLEVVGIIAADR
jgi:hypothetical protein